MRRAEWLPVAIALLALLGSYVAYPADPAESRPPPERPGGGPCAVPVPEAGSPPLAGLTELDLPRERVGLPRAERSPESLPPSAMDERETDETSRSVHEIATELEEGDAGEHAGKRGERLVHGHLALGRIHVHLRHNGPGPGKEGRPMRRLVSSPKNHYTCHSGVTGRLAVLMQPSRRLGFEKTPSECHRVPDGLVGTCASWKWGWQAYKDLSTACHITPTPPSTVTCLTHLSVKPPPLSSRRHRSGHPQSSFLASYWPELALSTRLRALFSLSSQTTRRLHGNHCRILLAPTGECHELNTRRQCNLGEMIVGCFTQ